MKRILISGYLGFENFGDEALLHILIKDLLEAGARLQDITVLSNNPYFTSNVYKVNSIQRWNLFEIFNTILNNNALIFIGGIFQDKTSQRSFFYYLLQLILAKFFQKEVVFYGSGIGPLEKKSSRFLFSYAAKNVSLITVRDDYSMQFTPFTEKVLVTCDPVWTIEADYTFQNQIPNINWEMPILGVSMRNDKHLKRFHLTNMADKLSKALNSMKDWQVVLIPCMLEEDLPVMYELLNLLAKKTGALGRVHLIENFNRFSISQQAGILSSCDVMVAMRYHAILVSLAYGKPVLGLIYDQKVKSLLDFASQVGVSFKDDFEQPWNYFWQNLEHSANLAREASEKAKLLHKRNKELLVRFLST